MHTGSEPEALGTLGQRPLQQCTCHTPHAPALCCPACSLGSMRASVKSMDEGVRTSMRQRAGQSGDTMAEAAVRCAVHAWPGEGEGLGRALAFGPQGSALGCLAGCLNGVPDPGAALLHCRAADFIGNYAHTCTHCLKLLVLRNKPLGINLASGMMGDLMFPHGLWLQGAACTAGEHQRRGGPQHGAQHGAHARTGGPRSLAVAQLHARRWGPRG